jgi:hypothetical protein
VITKELEPKELKRLQPLAPANNRFPNSILIRIRQLGPIIFTESQCSPIDGRILARFYAKAKQDSRSNNGYEYAHVAMAISGQDCEAIAQGLATAWHIGKSLGMEIGAKIATDAACDVIKKHFVKQS